MTRGRLALTALGIGLSAVAIVALLRVVRAGDVAEHLRATRVGWVLAAMAVTLFGYVLRALRWRDLLSSQASLPLGRVFGPTIVGFLAINTLPARLGEFVRAYVLARLERLSTAGVLGTCAVERVLDLVFLALFWVVSLSFAPFPDWFRLSGYLTFGIGGVGAVALWVFHVRIRDAERFLNGALVSRLPTKFREGLRAAVPAFGEGLRSLSRPGVLARAGAWSLAMWLVNGSVFLLIGLAAGIHLPWWSGFLLAFVVCVAILLPSSPGFVGVMEAACVVGLSLLGVDGAIGLAFGILYHISQIVPLAVLGIVYALRAHLRPSDLAAETP
jgi:uncharacterized protein (TIRG00374 family)